MFVQEGFGSPNPLFSLGIFDQRNATNVCMHEELCLEATDMHFRGLASSLQTKPLTPLGFTIAHWRVSNEDSVIVMTFWYVFRNGLNFFELFILFSIWD